MHCRKILTTAYLRISVIRFIFKLAVDAHVRFGEDRTTLTSNRKICLLYETPIIRVFFLFIAVIFVDYLSLVLIVCLLVCLFFFRMAFSIMSTYRAVHVYISRLLPFRQHLKILEDATFCLLTLTLHPPPLLYLEYFEDYNV